MNNAGQAALSVSISSVPRLCHRDYVGRWAPDGRRFFFITTLGNGEPWELHAYDEETGTIERVAAAAPGPPRWSRDGARMVWVVEQSVSQLWLMEKF